MKSSPEKLRKAVIRTKEWKLKNKEKHLAYERMAQKRSKEKWNQCRVNWRKNNQELVKAYAKKYREDEKNNPEKRIKRSLRKRLNFVVKYKSKIALELVGIPFPDFMKYMEGKFAKGMTWKNYGKVWHVDHIIPCKRFDFNKKEDQKRCFHYTNLQPLFASDNFKKQARIISPIQMNIAI